MSIAPKSLWMALFVLVCWVLPGASAAQQPPFLKHHLTVRLDPAGHSLRAQDRVDLLAPGVSAVEFHLADHLTVDRVTVNGAAADFSFDAGHSRTCGNGSDETLADDISRLLSREAQPRRLLELCVHQGTARSPSNASG